MDRCLRPATVNRSFSHETIFDHRVSPRQETSWMCLSTSWSFLENLTRPKGAYLAVSDPGVRGRFAREFGLSGRSVCRGSPIALEASETGESGDREGSAVAALTGKRCFSIAMCLCVSRKPRLKPCQYSCVKSCCSLSSATLLCIVLTMFSASWQDSRMAPNSEVALVSLPPRLPSSCSVCSSLSRSLL